MSRMSLLFLLIVFAVSMHEGVLQLKHVKVDLRPREHSGSITFAVSCFQLRHNAKPVTFGVITCERQNV